MKNIHILPTDKPSRLCFRNYYFINKDNIGTYSNVDFKNIYITSDEEIKEGDWVLMFDDLGNLFLCDKPQQYLGIEKGHHLNKGLRKIILTTDQDLIKDGVQAIDDEFLEWFIKNPNCEEVEVKKGFADGTAYGYNFLDYKIIIPKEEELSKDEIDRFFVDMVYNPKEEPKQIKCYCGHTTMCDCSPLEKPKQETLEEAAERYADYSNDYVPMSFGDKFNETTKTDFIEGAKWQAERSISKEAYEDSLNMQKCSNAGYESKISELQEQIKRSYSEEEVEGIIASLLHTPKLVEEGSWEDIAKWLEQFKKK